MATQGIAPHPAAPSSLTSPSLFLSAISPPCYLPQDCSGATQILFAVTQSDSALIPHVLTKLYGKTHLAERKGLPLESHLPYTALVILH